MRSINKALRAGIIALAMALVPLDTPVDPEPDNYCLRIPEIMLEDSGIQKTTIYSPESCLVSGNIEQT